MKTPHKAETDMAFLDDLIAERRAEAPEPSDAFMAQLQAQARAAQPEPQALAEPPRRTQTRWLDAIGGWFGAGGLAAATLVGLWIGIAQPDGLSGVISAFEAETLDVSLFAGDSYLLEDS